MGCNQMLKNHDTSKLVIIVSVKNIIIFSSQIYFLIFNNAQLTERVFRGCFLEGYAYESVVGRIKLVPVR